MVEEPVLRAFLREVGITDYPALVVRADADPSWFWERLLAFFSFSFDEEPRAMFDQTSPVEHRLWLPSATLRLADILLAGDAASLGADAAVVWEAEDGAVLSVSRAELGHDVRRVAAGLARIGIRSGDRVGILMPMRPETVVAFLALARLGAVALPLFSGFGAEAIATRLSDAGARGLIVADGTRRRGKVVDLKGVADRALEAAPSVEHVVVVRLVGSDAAPVAGRDHNWHELGADVRAAPAQAFDAEHPLMIVYTSGTTGNPKGTVHTQSGFLMKVACDLGLLLDVQRRDRILWLGDFGWLTGPILVTGALLTGATLVMAEGAPDYPDPDRVWKLIDRHDVTIFSLSPTLIRAAMRHPPPTRADTSRLRIVASTGEPWTQEAWDWCCQNVVPNGRLLNYTGGTEIGGSILSGNLLLPERPLSVGQPAPAMGATILAEDGAEAASGQLGELVLTQPSPGLSRGLWNANETYLSTYWTRFVGCWSHGDLVRRDEDGAWYVEGRRDELIKVAGKRISPLEVERVASRIDAIEDVAVVGTPDPVKGTAIAVVYVARSDRSRQISDAVVEAFGPAFRPRTVLRVPDLPRTRTNKVMRRVLERLLAGDKEVDIAQVSNPAAVDEMRVAIARLENEATSIDCVAPNMETKREP